MTADEITMPVKPGDFFFRDGQGNWNHWVAIGSMDPVMDPGTGREIPRRSEEEITESVRFGKLYQVDRITGITAHCYRVRVRKGVRVLDRSERVSIVRPYDREKWERESRMVQTSARGRSHGTSGDG